MTRSLALSLAFALSLSACAKNDGAAVPPTDFAAGTATHSAGTYAPGGYNREAGAQEAPSGYGGAASKSASPMEESIAYDDRGDGDGASVSSEPPPTPRRSRSLGTAYGESRHSSVRTVAFRRAHEHPDVVLHMRYNDAQGVADLASMQGVAVMPNATAYQGPLRVTLLGEYGSPLPGRQVGSEVYAVANAGERYMIGVENNTPERYEVLASVDGLDVVDGQEAGYGKRGYVVDPYTSFVIEGWRTSDQTVAAFRFSEIEDSYGALTGKARNIGVVGVAFFQEVPPADAYELQRRNSADPFPNKYAPPPPRYRY